jgi:hypothetical protein
MPQGKAVHPSPRRKTRRTRHRKLAYSRNSMLAENYVEALKSLTRILARDAARQDAHKTSTIRNKRA